MTFRASIDVLESMGADVFVYFAQGRETTASAAELEELARDSGQADTGATGDTVVARLSRRYPGPRGQRGGAVG